MPTENPSITQETSTQIWDRCFIEYGQFISKKFSEGRLDIQMLSNCSGVLEMMNECYKVMVKLKMTERLEDQHEHIKKDLKEIAAPYQKILSIDDRMKLCKTLLCIEILLND